MILNNRATCTTRYIAAQVVEAREVKSGNVFDVVPSASSHTARLTSGTLPVMTTPATGTLLRVLLKAN